MLPHIPGIYNLAKHDYLAANRRGTITEEQAALLGPAGRKLFKRFQRKPQLNGIIVIILLGFFLVLQVLGIEISTPIVMGAFGLLLVVLAVQLGRRWTSSRRNSALVAKDVERGVIHDGVGSLRFEGGGYRIVLPNRELELPLGSKEGLTPGATYRFYYLPESGVALSAEYLDEGTADRISDGLTAALAEANGFKLSSLKSNQQGKLTGEQIPHLYGGLLSPLIFVLVPGGFLAYQLMQAGVFSDPSLAGIFASLKELDTSLLVVVGILGGLAIWGLVLLLQTVLDMAGGQVASVEGVGYRQLKKSADDEGSYVTRQYMIDGVRFRVSQQGLNALEDGRTYRAYFTPRRKTLVNIEAID